MSPFRIAAVLAAATLLCACGGGAAAAERDNALSAFAAFQSALRAGDAEAAGRLVASDSLPALDQVQWHRVRGQQALQPVSVERHGHDFWIRVRDPNHGGAASTFVVARERGRYVVDLIATAGHHAAVVPREGPLQFDDRPLTPEEIEEIRSKARSAIR